MLHRGISQLLKVRWKSSTRPLNVIEDNLGGRGWSGIRSFKSLSYRISRLQVTGHLHLFFNCSTPPASKIPSISAHHTLVCPKQAPNNGRNRYRLPLGASRQPTLRVHRARKIRRRRPEGGAELFSPPLPTTGLKPILQARLQLAYLGFQCKEKEEEIGGWYRLDKAALQRKCTALGIEKKEIDGKTMQVLLRMVVMKLLGLTNENATHMQGVEHTAADAEIAGAGAAAPTQAAQKPQSSQADALVADAAPVSISQAQAQAQQATSTNASLDPILVSPPVAAHPPQDQTSQAPTLQKAISAISAIHAPAPGPRAITSQAPATQQATSAPAPNPHVIVAAAPLVAARPDIKLEVPPTNTALDTESSPPPSPSPVSDILWRLHDVFHTASGPAMYRLSDDDEVYLTELTRGCYKTFFWARGGDQAEGLLSWECWCVVVDREKGRGSKDF